MRAVFLLVMLFLLSACGSVSPRQRPAAPAPEARGIRPPPAWIETGSGTRWLGFSTYCWQRSEGDKSAGVCADFVKPECGQRIVPDVPVQRDETVRVHLGFTPGEATVEGAHARLEGRAVTWRIERPGVFVVFARPKGGGDASYTGCAVFTRR